MPIRNCHRPGDYLAIDDESGLCGYASDMRMRWDGAFVRAKGYETRHPQDFIRPRNDPAPLSIVRPQTPTELGCDVMPIFVGQTTVRTNLHGPLSNRLQAAIPDWEVGCSQVY